VNSRVLTVVTAVALLLAAGAAWARNPHCAGGIQYLVQSQGDALKGNKDDAARELQKSVQQLEQCSSEDPVDFEAIGYLGWAYALSDSMAAAGRAFQTSIDGLTTKGDKKKLDMVSTNRESFWATSFNSAIERIQKAQDDWNPYTNEPSNDAEKQAKADAGKKYAEAEHHLQNALYLKPGEARTLRNLGNVYAFQGRYADAETWFAKALASAPGDTDVVNAIKQTRAGHASQLVNEKKYDEAIQYYQGLVKDDAKNPDLWIGLGEAAIKKAQGAEGDAKKQAMCTAADAYAKAAAITPSFDLSYNAGVSYQGCGNVPAAEEQYKAALAAKPGDRDALINLSGVLADEKKFPDATASALKLVALDPKDKTGHRTVGSVYSRASDNLHSRQFLLAFLALDKGTLVKAPTPASGADGQKVAAKMGPPEAIYTWEGDGQKFETWFYWSKGQAYHFNAGAQQEKTDWSAALAAK
jgi:tetratricopeptide (TPR) repeat protein